MDTNSQVYTGNLISSESKINSGEIFIIPANGFKPYVLNETKSSISIRVREGVLNVTAGQFAEFLRQKSGL